MERRLKPMAACKEGKRGRRGLSTLEWIVIAIVALVMISYVLGYWKGIWTLVTGQADTAKGIFEGAIANAFPK